ncbi:MAG: M24 family metallopeptidase, partial [Candidatus Binatia bacterium]
WIEEIYTYGRARQVRYEGTGPKTPEEERFLSALEGAKIKGRNAAEALACVLQEKGLTHGHVALDHEGMAIEAKNFLRASLPQARFSDASDLFRLIRMVKTGEEIGRLREATALNEEAIEGIFKRACVGRDELELSQVYHEKIAGGRGQVEWHHLGSGRRSAGIFPPSRRRLEAGDLLRTDAGCILNSYHADTCASGVLGEPTAKQMRLFAAGQKGIQACLEILRPGCRPSELLEALHQGIARGGMPGVKKDFVGHTIGIEAREFPFDFSAPKKLSSPFLPETTDVPLEENMVVNIEVALVELGFGGIQIEHTLVLKNGGFEFIVPQERELIRI